MRVVVGRHGSSADIQVPSRFNYVSRAHARISDYPGGRYLLEDLNSSTSSTTNMSMVQFTCPM